MDYMITKSLVTFQWYIVVPNLWKIVQVIRRWKGENTHKHDKGKSPGIFLVEKKIRLNHDL